MTVDWRSARQRYLGWFERLPARLQGAVKALISICFLVFVITIPFYKGERFDTAPIPLKVLAWLFGLVLVAGVAVFGVLVLRWVVSQYMADNNEAVGWRRVLLSVLILWFGSHLLHFTAYAVWSVTPFAATQQHALAQYNTPCEMQIGDEEQGSQYDVDWHAGDRICAPLQRELIRLYPRPAWLFGAAPNYE